MNGNDASTGGGSTSLRRVLSSLTPEELHEALVLNFDSHSYRLPTEMSESEMAKCVIRALRDERNGDRVLPAFLSLHCCYLVKNAADICDWAMLHVETDDLGFDLWDARKFMSSVCAFACAELPRRKVEVKWNIKDSCVYSCFALTKLDDLPCRVDRSRTVYLVYFPSFPLIALHSSGEQALGVIHSCVEKTLHHTVVTKVSVPRTDVFSVFRFCIRRYSVNPLRDMGDIPEKLKAQPFEFKESMLPKDISNAERLECYRRVEEAEEFFGTEEAPSLRSFRRRVVNRETGRMEVSMEFKGPSVLESLRHLYVLGHLTRLENLEPALDGVEEVTVE